MSFLKVDFAENNQTVWNNKTSGSFRNSKGFIFERLEFLVRKKSILD